MRRYDTFGPPGSIGEGLLRIKDLEAKNAELTALLELSHNIYGAHCRRENELTAEVAKLRAALDAAADALQEIATKRKEGVQNLILRNENYTAASFAGETATFAIEASRACWAALGKDWGQG